MQRGTVRWAAVWNVRWKRWTTRGTAQARGTQSHTQQPSSTRLTRRSTTNTGNTAPPHTIAAVTCLTSVTTAAPPSSHPPPHPLKPASRHLHSAHLSLTYFGLQHLLPLTETPLQAAVDLFHQQSIERYYFTAPTLRSIFPNDNASSSRPHRYSSCPSSPRLSLKRLSFLPLLPSLQRPRLHLHHCRHRLSYHWPVAHPYYTRL